MRRAHALLAAIALLAVPFPAHAQATITVPLADNLGYLPADLVVSADAPVTLVNLDPVSSPDGAPHDIRSVRTRATKDRPWCVNFPGRQACPLLWTPLILALETAEVRGIGDLTPGVAYEYYCSYHSLMRGTITVAA